MENVKLERGGKRSFWVLGTGYDNPKIVLEYFLGSNESVYVDLSLTPMSQYQKQHEFPKMPFVNVCTPGSLVATKENWLGYIGKDNRDFDDKTFLNLVSIVEQCPVEIRCRLYRLDNGNVGIIAYASARDINDKFKKLDTLPKREKIVDSPVHNCSAGGINQYLERFKMGKVHKRSDIKQSKIDKFNKKSEKRRNKEPKFIEYCEKSIDDRGAIKCPYCQSSDIMPVGGPQRKAFSAGKAAVGGLLTGGIGLLAGFAGKKGNKAIFMCRNCNRTFEHKIAK